MAGKEGKASAPAPSGALDSIDLTPSTDGAEGSGEESGGDDALVASVDRALDPEDPDEKYAIEVTRKELALINLVRSISTGTITSMDISKGVPVSIQFVSNRINFGDSATTDALAKPINPEDRIFLR